jgi:membrane-bound lytic murein transglycosylase B
MAQEGSLDGWRQGLRTEALAAGISPTTVASALDDFAPDDRVVELDRKQPEHAITFATYLKNALPPSRLREGQRLMHANEAALSAAVHAYGVPANVIVALWGIESSFGKNMGGFDAVTSLATLAYEGRRAAFFRGELLEALRLIDEEGLTPSDLQGSWAGALGQCQFMPSTYRRYAVDADGDGKRDIWRDQRDVFASIARYLAAEGWKAGQSWGREVHVTHPVAVEAVGLEHTETLAAWAHLGVTGLGGLPLPKGGRDASLIQPDGPHGRSFLVYDNFRALMRWNRSTYFATTVGLFADQLKKGVHRP